MTDQLRDASNNPVERFKQGTTKTIALGVASVQLGTPIGDTCSLIEVVATQPAFLAIGVNPTASPTDRYLVADTPYEIAVQPGDQVAGLQAGTGGTLYVTELL